MNTINTKILICQSIVRITIGFKKKDVWMVEQVEWCKRKSWYYKFNAFQKMTRE